MRAGLLLALSLLAVLPGFATNLTQTFTTIAGSSFIASGDSEIPGFDYEYNGAVYPSVPAGFFPEVPYLYIINESNDLVELRIEAQDPSSQVKAAYPVVPCFISGVGCVYSADIVSNYVTASGIYVSIINGANVTLSKSDGAFTPYCADGDVGKNYYIQSSARVYSSESSYTEYSDVCLNSTTLIEAYCSGASNSFENYTCPNGCSSGACLESTSNGTFEVHTTPAGAKVYITSMSASPVTRYYGLTPINISLEPLYYDVTMNLSGYINKTYYSVMLESGNVVAFNEILTPLSNTCGNGVVEGSEQCDGSVGPCCNGCGFSNAVYCSSSCACTSIQCVDTDGGNNKTVKGTTYLNNNPNSNYTDYCSISTLYEYYCTGSAITATTTSCDSGQACSEGACVSSTASSTTCNDTDGGQVYGVKGYVNITGYGWDYCMSDGRLAENFCYASTSTPGTVAYTCPSGQVCSDGACTASTSSTTGATTPPVSSTGDVQIYPYASDVQKCYSSTGTAYNTTGEGAAPWFVWGGCSHSKEFNVTPNKIVRFYAYTDSCPGCACYFPDFDVYEYNGEYWVKKASYDNPNQKGYSVNINYTSSFDRIKVVTNNCFYLKAYQTQTTSTPTQNSESHETTTQTPVLISSNNTTTTDDSASHEEQVISQVVIESTKDAESNLETKTEVHKGKIQEVKAQENTLQRDYTVDEAKLKLAELVLKIESVKIRIDTIANKVNGIANYYESTNSSEEAQWVFIANKLGEVQSKLVKVKSDIITIKDVATVNNLLIIKNSLIGVFEDFMGVIDYIIGGGQ